MSAQLLRDGSVTCAVDGLGLTTAPQWRAAAHAAGDAARRPVRSGLASGGSVVWATVTDWPRTVEELHRVGQLNYTRMTRAEPAGAREGTL